MDKEGSTVIFCKKHQKHPVSFINISEENFKELRCDECLMEDDCQLKDYLSMQTINVCSNDHIFSNWPPVNNIKLLKDIQSLMKQDSLMIEELELQFQQIISEVTKKFEEVKKKLIQNLINSNEQKYEILKCYNQISGKEMLKELINFNKQNIENQLNDLRQFISLCQKQKDQNTTILQQQLQQFKNLQINQDDLSFLKQSSLKQIDIFCEQILIKIETKFQCQIKQKGQQINQLFGKFEFCDGYQSNQIQILENLNENKISIIKSNMYIYGQIYCRYELNKQKKYIVRFKFNDQIQDYLIIGLTNENNLQAFISSTYLGKIFGQNNQGYGGKVLQGNYFYQTKKDQIVEMRIDLQNESLQFLEYPDYQNINTLNSAQKLNQNGNYFLALQYGNNQQYQACVDLIYFEEIQK
ncbi:hypothetical protein ABPG72_007797 [Tetrahymena utriculariae]